ncbi:MAG: hypothetical protein QNJ31_07545 [Candidatus Caenarcaniphilales bacterium]|nr:hypothetical protein [Candidatus Caenarcaniphilales bacterium]
MESLFHKIFQAIQLAEELSDSEFNDLAIQLFKHQLENNQSYKKISSSRGVNSVKHWTEIPLITTNSFKIHKHFCFKEPQIIKTFFSSGTSTGEQSKHYLSNRELELYELSLWKSFGKAFNLKENYVEDDCNLAYLVLTENQEDKPDSSLIHMFETIRKRLNVDKHCFFYKNDRLQIERLVDSLKQAEIQQKKVLLVGTAFSFVHFLDGFNGEFHLPSNSILMETGGYKGKSREIPKGELYKILSKKLGIDPNNIIGQYGMSEIGTQFYDNVNPANSLLNNVSRSSFHFDLNSRVKMIPSWSRIRILDPNNLSQEVANDERGLIAIYDLCNIDSCSFILTGDIGIKKENSFEIIGRSNELSPKGCSLNYELS